MRYIEFRVYATDGTYVLLPDFTEWALSDEHNDVGFGSVTYPEGGRNSQYLVDQAEVAIVVDGVERLRFLVEDVQGADVEDGEIVKTFSGRSLLAILEWAIVYPSAWPARIPANHEFKDMTVGGIMKILLGACQNRGTISEITHASWTSTLDSAGQAWPVSNLGMTLPAGQTYLSVLQDLIQQGVVEARMVGRDLRLYKPDGMGAVRTTTLRSGGNITEASSHRTSRDLGTVHLASGENNTFEEVVDSASVTNWRRREKFSQHGGIADQGTLIVLATTQLNREKAPRVEMSTGLAFGADGVPEPWVDFDLADKVYRDTRGTLEQVKVKQIAMRGNDRQVTGGVVLNDKFYENDLAMARKIESIVKGANSTGLPVSSTPEEVPPTNPSGVTTTTHHYLDSTGKSLAQITGSWVAPPDDDIAGYVVQWRYTDDQAGFTAQQNLDFQSWQNGGFTDQLFMSFSPLLIDQNVQVRVQSVDRGGLRSGFIASPIIKTAKDTTTPPVPVAPVLTPVIGGIKVAWGGAFVSAARPADFSHVEIWLEAGVTDTLVGRFDAAASMTVAFANEAGVAKGFYLIAVDQSGLKSAASTTTTGNVGTVPLSDVDLTIGGVNVLRNSSFEEDVNGDGIPDGILEYANPAGQTIDATRAHPAYGTKSMKVDITSAGTVTTAASRIDGPLTAGSTEWTASVWVWIDSLHTTPSGPLLYIQSLNFGTGVATTLGTGVEADLTKRDQWQRIAVTRTLLADGTKARVLAPYQNVSATTGQRALVWYDNLQLEQGNVATSYAPYPSEILAGSITSDEIADLAITTAKIGDDQITNGKVAPNAIGTTEINNDAVTTAKIGNLQVTTGKVVDGAVTSAKMTSPMGDNLVPNPRWDAGFVGWTPPAGATIITEPDTQKSAKLTAATAILDLYPQEYISVTPGETLSVEAEIRADVGTNGDLTVGLFAYKADKTLPVSAYLIAGVQHAASTVAHATNYTKITKSITVGSDVHFIKPWLSLRNNSTTGAGYFRNMVVRRTVGSLQILAGAVIADKIAAGAVEANKLNVLVGGGNVLLNSSFEDGTTSHAAVNGATLTSVTTPRYHGAKALRVNCPTTTNQNGAFFTSGSLNTIGVDAPIKPLTKYVLSAWIYIPTTGGPTSGVMLSAQGAVSASAGTPYATTKDTWFRLQLPFTTTASGNLSTYALASNTTSGNIFYVDAVQLEVGDVATAYTPKTDEILPGTILANMIAANQISANELTIGLASEIDNAASASYVQSRGMQLVTNGTGLLGDNTNFSSFNFDPADHAPGAAGSFVDTTYSSTKFTDELIPVDALKTVTLTGSIRQRVAGIASKCYLGVAPYDVEGYAVIPQYYSYQPGTLTTLSKPLYNGATFMTLTSSAGWNNGGTAGVSTHIRSAIFWDYVDGKGYAWPVNTYSRNWVGNLYNPGGITASSRTNRFANPSAEVDTTGAGGSSVTVTRSTTWSAQGAASFRLTPNAASSDSFIHMEGDAGGLRVGMVAGNTYMISGTVNTPVAQTGTISATRARKIVVFYRANGGVLHEISSAAGPVTGSARVNLSFTLPADTTEAWVRFYNGASNTAANVVEWDGLMLENSGVLGTYIEGTVTTAVVTFISAWTGGTKEAGTPLSNGNAGGTYKYIAASNVIPTSDWTQYSGSIGGVNYDGVIYNNIWPPGTSFAKVLFLGNREVSGGQHALSGISLTEVATENLRDGSVTGTKIAQTTITGGNIATGTITSQEIYSGSVEASRIQANNVAAGAITANKLNIIVGGGNLYRDSSFEDVTNTRNPLGATLCTITRTTDTARHGARSLRVNWVSAGDVHVTSSNHMPAAIISGKTVTVSWDARCQTGTASVNNPAIQSASYVPLNSATGATAMALTSQWQRFTSTVTLPADVGDWRMVFRTTTVATNPVFYDRVQVELGDVPTQYSPMTDEILPGTIVATHLATDSVEADKIKAGAVVATKIAAGAVTTEKLTVAALGQNIVANAGFDEASAADATLPAKWYRWSGNMILNPNPFGLSRSPFSFDAEQSPGAGEESAMSHGFPVSGNKQYYFAADYITNLTSDATSSTATKPTVILRVIYSSLEFAAPRGNGTGTPYVTGHLGSYDVPHTYVGDSQWRTASGQFTPPTTAKWAVVHLIEIAHTGTGPHYMVWDNLELREVQVSASIADGAITTPKLIAGAVVAEKVAAGAITTEKMTIAALAGSNMVANGTFEDVSTYGQVMNTTDTTAYPAGWIDFIGAGRLGWESNTSILISGNRSFSRTTSIGTAEVGKGSRAIPVVAGEKYNIAGTFARSANTAGGTFALRAYFGSNDLFSRTAFVSDQPVTTENMATEALDGSALITPYTPGYFWEDVPNKSVSRFVQANSVKYNYAKNPNFETDLTHWEATRGLTQGTDFWQGTKSMKADLLYRDDYVETDGFVPEDAATDYTASAYVKTISGNSVEMYVRPQTTALNMYEGYSDVNLALGKTVTANWDPTITGARGPLSVITNGAYWDIDEYAGTDVAIYSGRSPRWVQVDLGSVQLVGRINVRHYFADLRTYHGSMDVSEDGVNWTRIKTDWPVEIQDGSGHVVDFAPRPIRYIKDTLTGSTLNYGTHWVEIQAFAPLPKATLSTTNVAKYVAPTVVRTNLHTNPSAENGLQHLVDYVAGAASTAVRERVAEGAPPAGVGGSWAFRCGGPSIDSTMRKGWYVYIPLTAGQLINASVYAKLEAAAAGANATFHIDYTGAGGAYIGTLGSTSTSATTYTRLNLAGTIPANTTGAYVYMWTTGPTTLGPAYGRFDGFLIETAATAPGLGAYFDGSSPDNTGGSPRYPNFTGEWHESTSILSSTPVVRARGGGGLTDQSTTLVRRNPNVVIDGNIHPANASTHLYTRDDIANGNVDRWVQIDLGTTKNLSQIKVWMHTDRRFTNDYVEVSPDGVTWTKVTRPAKGAISTAPDAWDTFGPHYSQGYYYGGAGVAQLGQNLCAGLTASAVTFSSGGSAITSSGVNGNANPMPGKELLFDGKIDQTAYVYIVTADASRKYVTVDMGMVKKVGAIRTAMYPDPRIYMGQRVEYSVDGVTWFLTDRPDTNQAGQDAITWFLGPNKTARYFRASSTHSTGSVNQNDVHWVELAAYEYDGSVTHNFVPAQYRYIRHHATGNNQEQGVHWHEIQAFAATAPDIAPANYSTSVVAAGAGYQRLSVTFQRPVDENVARSVGFRVRTGDAIYNRAATFHVDGVLIEKGSTPTTYFDGNTVYPRTVGYGELVRGASGTTPTRASGIVTVPVGARWMRVVPIIEDRSDYTYTGAWAEVEATRAVTASLLVDGTIEARHIKAKGLTADKIGTGELSAGTRIIAGPEDATHTEMTSTGFYVYANDPVDGVPNQVVRMGTDTDDFLAVTDANGNLLAAIDDEGKASFGGFVDVTNRYDTSISSRNIPGLTVQGDITIGGERLIGKLLRDRPLGVLAHYAFNAGGALPETNSEYGICQVNIRLPRGIGPRLLAIRSNNIEMCAITLGTYAAATMHIRHEWNDAGVNPPNPTVTSPVSASAVADVKTGWGPPFKWDHLWVADVKNTADFQAKYLFTYAGGGGDTQRVFPWIGRDAQFWVEDLGPWDATNVGGARSTGGGTPYTAPATPPPPPRSQKFYEGNATWNSTYRGDGSRRTDTSDTIQGYQSSNGNQKGLIGFDNGIAGMINQGNSPTVDRVEVYVYFNHWYYNSGGTAILGTHDATGVPGSWAGFGVWTDRMRIGGWPKPGGQWIDITSMSADGWRTGANRGISLGPGPDNAAEYYGRANAGGSIRIWYTN